MDRQELEVCLLFAGFCKFQKVAGEKSIADLFKSDQRTGIYILAFKEGDYYVGKATKVTQRFLSHSVEKGKIEAISFKTTLPEELTPTERKTIAALDSMGIPLRNITDTPNPNGRTVKTSKESPFTQDVRKLWFDKVDWNDLTGTPLDDAKVRTRHARKFKELAKHPRSVEICAAYGQYLKCCMPLPLQTAYCYWHLSCLTLGNLVSVSTNFQWVAVCYEENNEIYMNLWARATILRKKYKYDLIELERKYEIKTNQSNFTAGGTDQIIINAALSKIPLLLNDETILDAIRDLNMDLMLRGPTPFKRFHCFDLADAILERILNF